MYVKNDNVPMRAMHIPKIDIVFFSVAPPPIWTRLVSFTLNTFVENVKYHKILTQ